MSSDGARTARLVALMAGHGYAFAKLFDHFDAVLKDQTLPWATLITFAVPSLGIATAYLALCGKAGSRAARIAEQTSLFLLAVMMASILWIAAGKLGVVTIP
jgi:hypothetical protein